MLITVLVFLAILSVLVLIHEIGHFVAAKKMGIKVEEFGFGLPPRIFGIKRGETIYSINWLPIGGFVKLYGEDREDEGANSKSQAPNSKLKNRAFYSRPPWQRAIILVAGVTMNFVLAVVLLSYLFTQGVMVPTDRVHIEKIVAGSPAEKAGIKEKDVVKEFRIHSPAGELELRITKGEELIKLTKEHLGEEITLTIERDGKELPVTLTARKDYPKDQGPLGIVISNFEEKKYPLSEAPIMGLKESLKLSWELVKGIGITLWKLISFQSVSKDVAGPLGIAQMTGQAIKFGNLAVLELMGLLSLNLAIVNILPFPALDGGRLLFVVIEALTGKKIKAHWERYVHQIGMIILLALIVLVTLNDLVRIFGK
ncbi:RIP metalloprotease RseP [Candidatus Gottesmanbacteria bacterium RIFCSPHIGHO2_01_FULL_39_10]|uniref:Zinc metalloprotease n=1 Tax=Candidatus Gottesmanbacteria bacterium RIFCSPHIGHO2_01_FULL_39_10 TaxID=1798375 RepID=A0A1F5ZQA0_9BACT|nr:MAG: RIP metalloprotease RseP [Candidatus Gottesmanbacteria bacterium RIFCSPHIGHO2_01_FULL_39_10]